MGEWMTPQRPALSTRSRRSRRRGHPVRGERGAALLEFALVVPVFLLLVMGTIDFAMTFNDYNSVRQGVREGARQVVVASWDDAGCSSGSSAQRAVCVTKSRIGLDSSRTRVKILLQGQYQSGDPVQVCAMYQAQSITGVFSALLDSKVLTSKISMRIEQIDDQNPLVTYAESPLQGQSWSWCS
jgi:Flp pilus assembly protein TadG